MISCIVFLAPGFEEIEALTPVDYLRRAGVKVRTVAVPAQGKENDILVEGSHGIVVQADITLESYLAESSSFDAVVVPGGMPGAANLGACENVIELIKAAYKGGKLVAAICAAPVVVLSKTGVLAGHRWTCYPGMEKQVEDYCGGNFAALLNGSQWNGDTPFVTDRNLVTGRGPGCAEQFSMELVRILCGESVANKVHDGAVQR